jgi:cobyrinic acid a,c-diamide synthase
LIVPGSNELTDAFCDQVWLQDGLAASSLASYRRDLNTWSAWLERHAHKGLLAAERTDVEAFLAAQFQKKAKIASINRRLSTLRRFYRLHAAQATMAADPTLRVKSPKLPRSLPRNLSEDQVAALLGAPVILVVDARGQSHSLAALLQGFSTFHDSTRIAGVILNRVGSSRHAEVLRQACEHAGVPVLGALPRTAELSVPSRHLGLVTAVEHGRNAHTAVDAMTSLVAAHVDLPSVVATAGGHVAAQPWSPENAVGGRTADGVTVALAAGKAFSFSYAEHSELLSAAGADVVEFDPLTEQLPPGTAALVLPGGFPEEFSTELSANDRVRRQIAALAAAGAPVHAECAGLTYLVDELDGYPMCGVLAGTARFTDRLTLAYRNAAAAADSSLYGAGERVVGHEFHRTTVTFADSYQPAWVYRGHDVAAIRDGAVRGGVHASYLHTHPAGQPHATTRFVAAATSRLAG